MALSVSNVKATFIKPYMDGLRLPGSDWQKAFVQHGEDTPRIRIPRMDGIGTLSTWDGSSDLTTKSVDSNATLNMDYVQFGFQIRLNKLDVADVPNIVLLAARKAGVSVADRYATQAAAQLNGAFDSVTVADSQYLIDTDHTTATTTRSNDLSATALDRDAVFAALTAADAWTDFNDVPYSLADLGWYLVVPPALRQTANEIIGSNFSGADMQANTVGDVEVIVWNKLTSSTAWFMISKAEVMMGSGPVHFWERLAPTPNIVVDQDNLATKINVDVAIVSDSGPDASGIFGGAP